MYKKIPIWKDSTQLLVEVEQVVSCDMRGQAMLICRLVNRAWNDRANAARWLPQLVQAVDDFKLQLQVAKELKIFRNFMGV